VDNPRINNLSSGSDAGQALGRLDVQSLRHGQEFHDVEPPLTGFDAS
jgi:hypothetical protein